MFISSIELATPFGGLAAADTFCQARAKSLGLGGTFIAMLSTSTVNMRDRLAGSRGWVRLDGVSVLDQPSTGWTLQVNPIDVDETGTKDVSRNGVFTGTNDQGDVSATRTCGDWTATTNNGELRKPGFSGAIAGITTGRELRQPAKAVLRRDRKTSGARATPWPFGTSRVHDGR